MIPPFDWRAHPERRCTARVTAQTASYRPDGDAQCKREGHDTPEGLLCRRHTKAGREAFRSRLIATRAETRRRMRAKEAELEPPASAAERGREILRSVRRRPDGAWDVPDQVTIALSLAMEEGEHALRPLLSLIGVLDRLSEDTRSGIVMGMLAKEAGG